MSVEKDPAAHHLQVLRSLLARDYLSRADWGYALRDVAQMAAQAVGASRALVALYDADTGRWSAVSSDGSRLVDDEISSQASRSVLEKVRTTGQPLATLRDSAGGSSASAHRLAIEFVMAVPLTFLDVTGENPVRQLGGCLYAHRTAPADEFTEDEVQLILDITRIAQPTLNLLSHLKDLRAQLEESNDRLQAMTSLVARLGAYETHDPKFARETVDTLRRVAAAERVGLLILGPTGSGKTHLARAYHDACPRREGPFVTLDGAQVTSAETLAAELFGYAPNSGYANAPPKGRPGKAQLAHKGTLFIDEVAALPADLQQKLLRLLQNGCFSPLGTSDEAQADVQVIAATNSDLRELVRAGRFREDLYWRLGEITLRLPPLNERAADIPFLAKRFLESARERYGRNDVTGFGEEALGLLLRHDWSRAGNIRGLEHTINRAVLLAPAGVGMIRAEDVQLTDMGPMGSPAEGTPTPTDRLGAASVVPVADSRELRRAPVPPRTLAESDREKVRELLERKIAETGGTVAAMSTDAEVTGAFGYEKAMPDSTLAVWLRELGLEPALNAERQKRRESTDIEAIKDAVRLHGSGTAAAKVLGITRDTLVWRLRKAGLTIEDLLSGK